jgi:hypothetical protein
MDHLSAVVKRALCAALFLPLCVLAQVPAPGDLANLRLAHQLSSWAPAPGGGYVRVVGTSAPLAGSRIWSQAMGKVLATDATIVAARGGPLAVSVAQAVTGSGAAAAVGRCLMLANPACVAAGAAAAVAFEFWRMHEASSFPGTQCGSTPGALCADPGTPPVEQTTGSFYCQFSGTQVQGVTRQAACDALKAQLTGQVIYTGSQGTVTKVYDSCTVLSDTAGECTRHDQCSGPCWGEPGSSNFQTVATTIYPGGNITSTSCPASTDASNPAYNVPAGGSPGPDGKCPTARYNHAPVSLEQAVAKTQAHPPADQGEFWKDPLKNAIESGQWAPAEVTSTGPGSQTGTPTETVTTGPNGTTTTTSTPTHSYSYGGDTINVTTSTTTNTCTGAGSCTTANATTTTTTTEPTKDQDPDDPCTANPDRAGCAKLGTAPDPDAMPGKSVSVSITPETGFGADTGTCPAMVQTQLVGAVDPFGLVCTYMSGIRFAVIGIAWIMAALIFLGRVD